VRAHPKLVGLSKDFLGKHSIIPAGPPLFLSLQVLGLL
jgi:hypothetical protein